MNAKTAKKMRREARKAVRSQTKVELRWFAKPAVMALWFKPSRAFVETAVRLGWRSLGLRWFRFTQRLPELGIRFVVRGA